MRLIYQLYCDAREVLKDLCIQVNISRACGRSKSNMKPPLFTLTLLALVALCAAWTKEDHEIFRVRDDLIAAEGDNVTFYSFIGVSPSASADAIIKQVRQRSRQLHPDKAIPLLISRRSQGVKESGANKKAPTSKERRQISQEATQRYQRFTVIRDILQGPSRERYDHFLRNGFPLWRGSGYYYDRLRPGLGSVLVGLLLVFGGGAHYAAMYVGWKRHRDFVERYIANAQRMAWGEAGIPGIPNLTPGSEGTFATTNTATEVDPTASDPVMALNRKQKRMQEKENKKKDTGKAAKSAKTSGISKPVASEPMTGPQGSKKKVVAENGKVLIVDAIGNVFLETQTEEGEKHQLLLDVSYAFSMYTFLRC